MKLSKLALAGTTALLLSLSTQAALVTYKFTGEVINASGTLSAPAGTEVEGIFTYDPETWIQQCECSGGVKYHSDGVNHGFNLSVGDLYESLAPLPDDLHSIDVFSALGEDNRWNYARRIRDFGDPYYNKAIVFINILAGASPNFPTDIFDPLILPSGVNHNGTMIDYDQHVEVGRVGFNITSLSQVPIPAAAWLFGSALLGLFELRQRT